MFKIKEGTVFTDGTLDLEVVKNYSGAGEESLLPCYRCRLRLAGTDSKVGTISLRLNTVRNDELYYDGNLGYYIREEFRGKGYAVNGCVLAAGLAKAEGMTELVICCDVENTLSINVIKKLGATFSEVIEVPEDYRDDHDTSGKRNRYIWSLP